jgi:oligopeptide transport system ATP-binding protein
MQMIFQDPYASLNARMTVRDLIAEPLRAHRVTASREEEDDLIREMLEKVGLTGEHAGRYAHEFSGGQRQRVGVARALILRPELVICDEPVSALDVSIQAQIVNMLRDFQQELGLAYLFIAHDLSIVRYVSDEVGVMYMGKLVEHSEAADIYEHPLHPYTQGLLASIPTADPKLARRKTGSGLTGDIPSPIDPPAGCRFHTRCPYALARCAQEEPPLREAAPKHAVACFAVTGQ